MTSAAPSVSAEKLLPPTLHTLHFVHTLKASHPTMQYHAHVSKDVGGLTQRGSQGGGSEHRTRKERLPQGPQQDDRYAVCSVSREHVGPSE